MARTIVCSSWPIFASFPNDLASVCGLSCLGVRVRENQTSCVWEGICLCLLMRIAARC